MRCGYRSPRRQSSFSALRSASASKTGRDPPLCTIDEEILDFAHLDAPSDQRTAKGFSLASGSPPATSEPVGDVFPPQGLNAATPFAHKRDTFVPDGARRGILNEHIPPVPPTVLTTPFFVDALKSPSAQAAEDSLTLSRKVGQEPPVAPRKISGTTVTTHLGECVPTSGPQIRTPEGQVARRVPFTKNGPSSYPGGVKRPPPAHAAPTSPA